MTDSLVLPPATSNNPVVETWRATVWGVGYQFFLVEVYADRTWRLAHIGLERLGERCLIEQARGGPAVDLEREIRAALAHYRGTLTLQPDSPAERRRRWAERVSSRNVKGR